MISFTKCYKEATDEQRAGLILDSAFMAEVEQLKKAYNGEVIHIACKKGQTNEKIKITNTKQC